MDTSASKISASKLKVKDAEGDPVKYKDAEADTLQ
jgi:hypothetical protein